jgi:hypothetical protein
MALNKYRLEADDVYSRSPALPISSWILNSEFCLLSYPIPAVQIDSNRRRKAPPSALRSPNQY